MKDLALYLITLITGISYVLMVLLMIQEWPSFVNVDNIAYYAMGLPAVMMFGVLGMFTLHNKVE
jgi:hypothetical protein